MATKLMLVSTAFPSSYHHYKFHIRKPSITLLRRPYCIISPTTLSEPLVFKHDIIDQNFSPTKVNDNTLQGKISKTPIELFLDQVSNTMKALRKPMVAVVVTCLMMLMYDHRHVAWGASGGCMGGGSFSSGSSSGGYSSSSDSDSSYSSSSSSSSSYSSGSSSSYGGNDGVVAKEWTEEDSRRFWRFIGFCVAFISAIVVICKVYEDHQLTAKERNSIVKLQVGLLGTAKSLQSELNQIALTADTSTPKGISYVLTETILALLRHPDYFISAHSSVKTKRRLAHGEKLFRKMSIEERAKFDEETLVNLNNIKKQKKRNAEATEGGSSEFMVVTILAAVKGVLVLPAIKGNVELKAALQNLGSIPYQETIAAEVLWTPQEENDILTEKEYQEDYPLLKPLDEDFTL